MMGVQYTICHWAINRTDPQNSLSTILDVPLHYLLICLISYSIFIALRCDWHLLKGLFKGFLEPLRL